MTAFTGSINLNDNVTLADSLNGVLNLLAEKNINIGATTSAGVNLGGTVSTGASLIDAAFNAYAPDDGLYAGNSKPLLAHAGDHRLNHLYAVTGKIKGGAGRFESNRPLAVRAGTDILDLNLAVQNVNVDDVSSLIAGRDLSYTGTFNFGGIQIAGPGFLLVEAGRDLGPFLPLANDTAVKALVPEGIQSVGNNGILVAQNPLAATPILSPFPVGNEPTTLFAPPNPEFLGSTTSSCTPSCWSGMRNFLLPDTGASIVAMFGVAKGFNYQGVINAYVDPANAANVPYNYDYNTKALRAYLDTGSVISALEADSARNKLAALGINIFQAGDAKAIDQSKLDSLSEQQAWAVFNVLPNDSKHGLVDLAAFLSGLGKSTTGQADALSQFKSLPLQLQQIFADQVFFAELKTTGIPDTPSYKQYQRGYAMVNTMFPADVSASGLYGYTRNDLGGGSNGANAPVHAGNLDILHGTIQTQKGGDISIFGPGGSILVGSVATEPNKNLKPNYLGILTLAGGGINTFTDADVLVNASRVMTWFGGDILMWSSNGDIDAGRGARTTLSFPPLKVNFNLDDLETVDLGGSVSGAGIAVLQTKSFAIKSNAYLLAPRGTVDAGDAGIRVSGNLSILAVQVLNADNIQVGGKASGVPTVQAPNIAGLTSANNTAGAAAKTATPTADKPADRPSVIIVEVVGYGGGDNTDEPPLRPKKPQPADDRQGYNPNGNARVLGYATLGDSEMIGLTEKEKQAIRN